MRLIVGLGNPGPRYRETRHNAGFLVLDEVARRHGAAFAKTRGDAERARVDGLTLLRPLTFMNLSGKAVQAAMTRGGIRPEELLVIHDDLDLPFGRLRLKPGGGGAGGQKGVHDIIRRIGPEFPRLKIGIDRPPAGWSTERWVLSPFAAEELELLDRVIEAASDAVETVLRDGLEAGMNRVNGLELRETASGAATDGTRNGP